MADGAERIFEQIPARPAPASPRLHLVASGTDQIAIDPLAQPAAPELVNRLGVRECLGLGILPWRKIGARTIILTGPRGLDPAVQDHLTTVFGPIRLATAAQDRLQTALRRASDDTLSQRAETRTPAAYSCRSLGTRNVQIGLKLLAVSLITLGVLHPSTTLILLSALGIGAVLASTGLKLLAAVAHLRARPATADPVPNDKEALPVITVLVPLFREHSIATHLLQRLMALNYPRNRLDICLVTEAGDLVTRSTIAATELPPWIRALEVPSGSLQTKPRALNYALDFARGEIIGIYDAEDAPDPDQLLIVAQRFATADPSVACLQGVLDFYNAQSNWLARCFTIEYATWFRILLPGLQRLGLVMPLGGTTLFLRRAILEEIGAWDAHNVTEDADLGLRLARKGYLTEMIPTVTEEEANARTWPWIRQRSRWLKGYAITYMTHMRRPDRLWRDLGPWRFFGVQVLFGGTLLSFLLAPVLWSFWLALLGWDHPAFSALPKPAVIALTFLFLSAEVTNICLAAIAVTAARKRDLIKWAPSLHLYFPLAAIASYKGVAELFWRPFYWDKTAHGIFAPTGGAAPQSPVSAPASSLRRVTKASDM